jgi:hypothetical protein
LVLKVCGAPCFAGEWFMTLFCNVDRVSDYNSRLAQQLPGVLLLMRLTARLRDSVAGRPAVEQQRIKRLAMMQIALRLHHDPRMADSDPWQRAGADWMAFGLKVGMPVLVSQRFVGVEVRAIGG